VTEHLPHDSVVLRHSAAATVGGGVRTLAPDHAEIGKPIATKDDDMATTKAVGTDMVFCKTKLCLRVAKN
jgi:hypothetical protein